MQTLGLDEEKAAKPKGFWRRQFQQEPTKAQYKFDWMFGVIMPVVCFFFDPAIFSNAWMAEPFLGVIKPFAYLVSFTGTMAMMAWLIWGTRLKWLSAILGGLFLLCGAVALTIGVVMLPFSLVGLLILIGALGFTPLFTGIVYLRNGVRAIRAAEPLLAKQLLVHVVLLSALAIGIIPYVINAEINSSLERIKNGDAQTIRYEGRKLGFVSPLVNANALIRPYRFENNIDRTERLQALADVYRHLTGKNITGGFD